MPPLPRSPLSVVGKYAGSAASNTAAFAGGAAIAPALTPILQALRNETWKKYPDVPPDVYVLAEGVAQGQVDPAQAKEWAAEQGIGPKQWAALVDVANTGPALGYAFEAWRRINPATGETYLSDAQFVTALKRTGLEPQWYDALKGLKLRLLDPADLARAIHKSLIPDPGLLAVPQPQGVGKVKPYPLYQIDALASAAGYGYTKEELGVLVGLQGNPMGAHEAAQAVFRGVLDPVDYDRAIAEGNTRNEWGPAIMEQSRQIATSIEAVENHLRGYSDESTMRARTARHGMTDEDTTILFQNAGRPLTIHQITTGLARGGKFNPEPGELTDPYQAAVQESSIKPAYYDLAIANKYTLPSYFVLKQILADGGLTEPELADLFRQEGWPPDLADKAAAAIAKGAGPKSSSWVSKAQGYLFTAIHKGYEDKPEYLAKARAGMTMIGIPDADQTTILALFQAEASL